MFSVCIVAASFGGISGWRKPRRSRVNYEIQPLNIGQTTAMTYDPQISKVGEVYKTEEAIKILIIHENLIDTQALA